MAAVSFTKPEVVITQPWLDISLQICLQYVRKASMHSVTIAGSE